jgi:uncharacterized membrane protein
MSATASPARVRVPTERIREVALAASLLFVFVTVRVANLTTFCLDSDEVFSVRISRLGWGAMLDAAARDAVHPPLFYALLKVWIAIGGESRVWMRLLPLAFSLAAAPLFLALCRQLGLARAQTALGFFFLAVNPYQVFHSQYVRMYSLAFLLSLCSLAAFVRFTNTESRAWLLDAANLLLVFTHYFGWLLVGAELLCLAVWRDKRLRRAVVGAGLVSLCAAPWLVAAWRGATAKGGLAVNLHWIERPGLAQFVWYFAGLNGPIRPYAMAIALIPAFMAALIFGLRADLRAARCSMEWRRKAMLLALGFVPPAAAFVISNVAAQSIWGSRYLIVAAAPYFILLAIAVHALPGRIRKAALCATVGFLAYGAVQLAIWPEPRVDIESVARRIEAAETGACQRVAVYSLDRPLAYTLAYFFEHAPFIHAAPLRSAGELREPRCWIVYTNHTARRRGNPEPQLSSQGYRVLRRVSARDEWNEIIAIQVQIEERQDRTGKVMRHS